MSLCFDMPETRRLGVEGHVCELQLLPAILAGPQVCTERCVCVTSVRELDQAGRKS